jgi:hypothetical protein
LANQAGVWQPWSEQHRGKLRQFRFEPIDPDALRAQLDRDRRFIAHCRDSLTAAGTRFLDLSYESLFEDAVTPEEQWLVIAEVVDFLGLPPFDADGYQAVAAVLAESATRSDSHHLYRRIPNVDEIERTVGNAETGWLFA